MALLSGVEVSGRDLRVNRSRSAIVVAAVVLVPLVGACSGEPEPQFAPAESSSPAMTPESTASAPSPSNPVGTVRAWVAARNAALDSGDTEAVEGLSARGCTTCAGLIDPIKRIYAAGGHFDTSGWRIMKAKPRDTAGSKLVVDTAISIAGGATVTEAGGKPNKYPSEEHLVVFKLARDSDAWGIVFVGFLS
jgi:hypothetical protein